LNSSPRSAISAGTTFKARGSAVTSADVMEAAWRYVDFFTANIRNPHTRRAYARACNRFFGWCDDRALTPAAIRPYDVATYIEQLQNEVSAPSVKQQLAAIRMLLDWLVTGRVVPATPAAPVRGAPSMWSRPARTPALEGAEWRKLLGSIPSTTLRDLRDRALIATLTYSFARINAALKIKVEDLRLRGAGWTIRLHEKGGKQHTMPCHHALAEASRRNVRATCGVRPDARPSRGRARAAKNYRETQCRRADSNPLHRCKIRRATPHSLV
jgi:site-specific recombinase XerD